MGKMALGGGGGCVPAPVKQLPIDVAAERRLSAERGFVQDVPYTSLPTQ